MQSTAASTDWVFIRNRELWSLFQFENHVKLSRSAGTDELSAVSRDVMLVWILRIQKVSETQYLDWLEYFFSRKKVSKLT